MAVFQHVSPALAVDLAILSAGEGGLRAVFARRDDADAVGGAWALPGGFVTEGQGPDARVAEVLQTKTGLTGVHFEQLATYGAPDRDPRGHVVSITYLALVPEAVLRPQVEAAPDLTLAQVDVDWPGETGGPATAVGPAGALDLAFDHDVILGDAVKRLRGKLDYTPIGFAFLPPRFTLRDAQTVHEAVLGGPLNKPAFRRKLLDRHALRPTGERESGGAFRPAELYERQIEKA
ncbi:MAG: NUDIX hydrolase [Pseudomonadota bacterium]